MATKPSQRTDAPSPTKAHLILDVKTFQDIRSHPLTKAQRERFGAIAATVKGQARRVVDHLCDKAPRR